MRLQKTRGVVIVCGTLLLLGGSARESFALCDWLFSCCHPKPAAVTTYTPPFTGRAVAVAPVAAAVPATCSYVPQTCYRTVYQAVPVTTCQAVSSCDPCTGCPVTTFRPTTVYAYRPQVVPFTTYRMVCSSPCAPCAPQACSPYGTGVVSSAPVASGCPTCTTSPAPSSIVPSPLPATPAPMLPAPSSSILPSTAPGPAVPSTSPGGTTPTAPAGPPPTYAPPSSSPPSGAYQGSMTPMNSGGLRTSSGSLYTPTTRLRLTPNSTTPATVPMSKPRPQTETPTGRTAVRPVVPAAWYQPVSLSRSSVTGEPLDIGGWQPIK